MLNLLFDKTTKKENKMNQTTIREAIRDDEGFLLGTIQTTIVHKPSTCILCKKRANLEIVYHGCNSEHKVVPFCNNDTTCETVARSESRMKNRKFSARKTYFKNKK